MGRHTGEGLVPFKEDVVELSFSLNSAEAGQTATLLIKGKLEGDEIKGTWNWEAHSGTFRARRAD